MSKIILVLFFFFYSIFSFSQQIKWMSLEEALKAQKSIPKKIMMDVYTNWCGPCRLMDKNTFQNMDVASYVNEYYYAVKFDAEGEEIINFFNQTFTNPNFDSNRKGRNGTHQFTQFLGVKGYPTVVFFSENADPIIPLVGYQKPQQLELFLKMIKQGDYQVFSKPEDFEVYQKNFRPKFKG
jgi:thioredoxin-related protein